MSALSKKDLLKLSSDVRQGKILPIIYGEDFGVVEHTFERLLAPIKVEEQIDRVTWINEAELADRFEDVLERLEAQDLWGGKSLYALRLDSERQSRNVIKLIKTYEARPFPNILIVLARKIARKGALFKAIEQTPCVQRVACKADTPEDLQAVIQEVFDAAGVQIAPDALLAMREAYQGSRHIALQEAEKLSLYGLSLGGVLTAADVLPEMGAKSDYQFQDLIYPTLRGEIAHVPVALRRLFESGKAGISILRALQNETQRMIDVKQAMMRGDRRPEMACKPPVFSQDWQGFQQRLNIWSMSHLIRILERIAECEAQTRLDGDITRPLVLTLLNDLANFAHTRSGAA